MHVKSGFVEAGKGRRGRVAVRSGSDGSVVFFYCILLFAFLAVPVIFKRDVRCWIKVG